MVVSAVRQPRRTSLTLVGLGAGLAVTCLAQPLAPVQAQQVSGFQGFYAPAAWTASLNVGLINTLNAPASLSLTSKDAGSGPSNTDFTITLPVDGEVSFSWNYVTSEGNANDDPFGYLLNGTFFQLSQDNNGQIQSGSITLPVLGGDLFGFRQSSTDSAGGSATTTISAFSAPVADVPAPLPLLGAAAGLAWSRRLRRRQARATPFAVDPGRRG